MILQIIISPVLSCFETHRTFTPHSRFNAYLKLIEASKTRRTRILCRERTHTYVTKQKRKSDDVLRRLYEFQRCEISRQLLYPQILKRYVQDRILPDAFHVHDRADAEFGMRHPHSDAESA